MKNKAKSNVKKQLQDSMEKAHLILKAKYSQDAYNATLSLYQMLIMQYSDLKRTDIINSSFFYIEHAEQLASILLKLKYKAEGDGMIKHIKIWMLNAAFELYAGNHVLIENVSEEYKAEMQLLGSSIQLDQSFLSKLKRKANVKKAFVIKNKIKTKNNRKKKKRRRK